MDVNDASKDASNELLGRANVVGVGVGYKVTNGEIVRNDEGNPVECVVVSVTQKVATGELRAADMVPNEVGGVTTDVVETGAITILSDQPTAAMVDPQQRIRPVTPGLSIGLNPGVTAGTLGFIVQRGGGSDRYLLSNWHVIAANNTPIEDRDVLTITQPGNADGGSPPGDVIARLSEFAPIGSGGGNVPIPSDCNIAGAIARVLNGLASIAGSETRLVPVVETKMDGDNLVDAAIGLLEVDYDRTTPEIGIVTETAAPTLGMRVHKFGRTTSYTVGTVTQVNATFSVQGYPGGAATFVDQVAITADSGSFLQGGDSGSGLVSVDGGEAVGLCFAGSPQIGIANTWPNVEAALNVRPAGS